MADPSTLTNPFAALTVIVAPAILTNASSVLAMGTANRIARVVDRTRVVAKELAEIEDQTTRAFLIRVNQLSRLSMRSQCLFWALRFTYASLGLFAFAALIAVVGSVMSYYGLQLAFRAVSVVGLTTFVCAVISLVSGCVLMVHEVRLALASLVEEEGLAREHYRP
jgi:hypothetical protein